MILIDRNFLTDLGIVSVDPNAKNKVTFHKDLVMTTETIKTFRRFYELATINGINYKTEVGFYNNIGAFYGEPDIKDLVSFMNNATFNGVNPIGDFVTYYKGVANIVNQINNYGQYYMDSADTDTGIYFSDTTKFRDFFCTSSWSSRINFRRTSIGAQKYLFSKWQSPSNKQIILRFSSTNEIEYSVSTDGVNTYKRQTTTQFTDMTNIDLWFCVDYLDPVCTHYVYYNGVRHDLDNITSGVQNDFESITCLGAAEMSIGNIDARTVPFSGMIGEVAFLQEVVTQTDVNTVYNGGEPLPYTELATLNWLEGYRFVDDTYSVTSFTVVGDEGYCDGGWQGSGNFHFLQGKMLGSIKMGIAAGQSNLVGREDLINLPAQYANSTKDVNLWNGSKYQFMNITTNNNQLGQPSSQWGFEAYLSNYVTDKTRSLHILKYGVGGTDLYTDWKPTATKGANYNQLLTYISDVETYYNALNIPFTWDYFIWIQGERDCKDNTKTADYETNLTNLLTNVATETSNANLKHIIIELNINFTDLNPTYLTNLNTIRTAQADVVALDSGNRTLINMDDATFLDGVHYDGDGYLLMGERIVDELNTFL
jgi:hypothetical protein